MAKSGLEPEELDTLAMLARNGQLWIGSTTDARRAVDRIPDLYRVYELAAEAARLRTAGGPA